MALYRGPRGPQMPRVPGLSVVLGEVVNLHSGQILSRDDGTPIGWRWWAVSITLADRCRSCGRSGDLHWSGCPGGL